MLWRARRKRAPADGDRRDHPRGVVREQHRVRGLGRDPAASRRERDADGGAAQRRRVVGAVADHEDLLAGFHQPPHVGHLVLGQQLSVRFPDADRPGDRIGVRLVVAREQDHPPEAERPETRDQSLELRPDPVGVLDDPRRLSVHRHEGAQRRTPVRPAERLQLLVDPGIARRQIRPSPRPRPPVPRPSRRRPDRGPPRCPAAPAARDRAPVPPRLPCAPAGAPSPARPPRPDGAARPR